MSQHRALKHQVLAMKVIPNKAVLCFRVDTEFERANAWRLETLSWCKCGHCAVSKKIIECFCCLEKAVKYDEYGMLLDQVEAHGNKCLTKHPDFRDNMLSESVLKIDVCRYLEENWPLDDGDLEKVHKLYRLVSYQRCSVFTLDFPDFG